MHKFDEYALCTRVRQQPKTWFLTDTGLEGGTREILADHSSSPGRYYIMPPDDKVFIVARILVLIRDNSVVSAEKYGGLAALSTGVRLDVRLGDDIEYSLLAGDTIKNNVDWKRYSFDTELTSWGSGDTFITARWTFEKHGRPLILRGELAERLTLTANDNFTGLVSHTVCVQGFEIESDALLDFDRSAIGAYKSFVEPA